ncbi:MAG: protein kinase [Alphaproteobacteria bacterium]|nr:protein kinase [Alphaproteobacteria bacterium]
MPAPGEQIGAWVLEAPLDAPDRWQCHRVDTPFRKAEATWLQGPEVDALVQDARQLERLAHPAIPRVLAVERSGDGVWVVTETAARTSLGSWIRDPPLPIRAALEALVQVARALLAAHDSGVRHGRLHRDTVRLDRDGRVQLVDFTPRAHRTEAAPPYRAPEPGEAGPLQDAYGLGVLAAELLDGRMRTASDPAPLTIDRDVPARIADLTRRLTDPRVDRRATVAEGVRMLEATLAELPAGPDEAAPEPRPKRGPPPRIGRYEITRELGRGGMGVVYEGVDPDLRRAVAVKVLRSGALALDREIERFLREARAVARLDHPGIVRILDLGRGDDGAWFAMELVEGPTLADRLTQGPLPWREAVEIASGVARALDAAHAEGIVHRDVKPGNILLEGGVPRLTDFGLAFDATDADARLTQTGQMLGTPLYISPEQSLGRSDIGPPTDIYALGAVLYECLVGEAPFESATAGDVLQRLRGGSPPSPRTFDPGIPEHVARVCLQAVAYEPDARYPSGAAFAEDLDRCLRDEPVLARVPPPRRRAGSTRWVAVAGGVALAVAAVGFLALRPAAVDGREQLAAARLATVSERLADLEASGRTAEADELWAAFEAEPALQQTVARTHGWMLRARQLAERGEADASSAAWSAAYADAEADDDQIEALTGLARAVAHADDADRLPRVMRLLAERAPERFESADLAPLRVLADALLLRLSEAAGRAEGRAASVLRALASATPTAHRDVGLLETPGGALLLVDRTDVDSLRVVERGPTLHATGVRRLPRGTRPNSVHALTDRLFARTDLATDEGVLVEGDGDLVEVLRWPHARISASARADLDGDGQEELYVGASRRLWRVDRTEAGWSVADAHRGTSHANSEIPAMAAADVDGDGDGSDELVVLSAEWGAYDLRVLDGDPARLRGRIKLGTLMDLAVLPGEDHPRFAVVKQDRYPNRRVFPEDGTLGSPEGIYLIAGPPEAMEAERILDISCGRIRSGDLDGDGQTELVATCGFDAWIVTDPGLPTQSAIRLPRVQPLHLTDLDGDGDVELVVRHRDDDERLWVLGTGDAHLPLRPFDLAVPVAPPSDADPATADAWRRADDLALVGQLEAAAAAFQRLAVLASRPELAHAARVRAAEVSAARGDHAGAARLFEEEAGDDAGLLRSAAAAWRDDVEPVRERSVLQRLAAVGSATSADLERLDELEALIDPTRLELDLTKPLDAGWEVLNPVALRSGPQGLEVDAWQREVLARRPIRWDGGWLRLEVDLVTPRVDWGSTFTIALVPRGQAVPLTGIQVSGGGGGGVVEKRTDCRIGPEMVWDEQPLDTLTTVTFDIWPDRSGLRCTMAEGGQVRYRQELVRPMLPPGAREWDLALVSSGTHALAHGLLRRIAMVNVDEDPWTPTPLATAMRLVANGDPGGARRLVPPGEDASLDAAIALHTGDDAGLADAVRRLDAQGRNGFVELLLHLHVDRVAPVVRQALGPRWIRVFHDAWYTTLQAHEDDVEAKQALRWVADVDPASLPRSDDRAALAELLSMRDDDLEGTLALFEALLADPSLSPDPRKEVEDRMPHLRRALARHVLRSGDPDAALDILDALLHEAPAPEVTADMLSVDPGLAPLREHPRWAGIVERVRNPRPTADALPSP